MLDKVARKLLRVFAGEAEHLSATLLRSGSLVRAPTSLITVSGRFLQAARPTIPFAAERKYTQ
jgi:hypothetical protein